MRPSSGEEGSIWDHQHCVHRRKGTLIATRAWKVLLNRCNNDVLGWPIHEANQTSCLGHEIAGGCVCAHFCPPTCLHGSSFHFMEWKRNRGEIGRGNEDGVRVLSYRKVAGGGGALESGRLVHKWLIARVSLRSPDDPAWQILPPPYCMMCQPLLLLQFNAPAQYSSPFHISSSFSNPRREGGAGAGTVQRQRWAPPPICFLREPLQLASWIGLPWA